MIVSGSVSVTDGLDLDSANAIIITSGSMLQTDGFEIPSMAGLIYTPSIAKFLNFF
jgi:hypothetical protein